jgi:hypothetical protein
MSTDHERDIRDRLGGALDTITPPSPPVGAVMRQGRTIRMRRRAVLAAGLAVVVGLGIALPGLVGHVRAAPPVQQPSYRVTVNPPRSTPSRLTFSGTINGKPWRISLNWDGGNIMEGGPGLPFDSMTDMSPDGAPANLGQLGSSSRETMVGQVRRDVAYLALNQLRGSVVYLNPVRWHNERWVGVEFPANLRLRSVVAYSGHAELAYAIPFGANSIEGWLVPGQRVLARRTVQIASGTLSGKRWSVYGYAGPWGICFQTIGGDGGDCLDGAGSAIAHGHLTQWMGCGGGPGQISSGQVASDVSYLKFRLADGSTQRVVPAGLAGHRYFAFVIGAHQRVVSWTAHRASGQVLGGGHSWRTC